MVAYPRQRLNLPIAGAAGAVSALIAALAFAFAPLSLVESLVVASGLPGLVAAAEPPLGNTARALLCFVGSVGTGATVFLIAARLFGDRCMTIGRGDADMERVPVVRRADSHPDAPPRPPVIATRELGAPMMSVGTEEEARDLPGDLDTPLAEYDPQAFVESHPPQPLPSDDEPDYGVAAPAPLPRPAIFEAGERFQTFPLDPSAIPDNFTRPSAPGHDVSVPALLDRLEASVARRAGPPRAEQGDDRLSMAIDSLRRLAATG